MKGATAILFFSRSPEEELMEKKFHQDRSKAYQIARFLVSRTRNILKQTGLPVFEVNSLNQTGNTPNERFHNAITHIFSNGYKQVIAVGNDCPQLTPQDILKAKEALETKSIVLGPDLRGGAFLIGVKKEHYQPNLILNTPWGSRNFLKTITDHFKADELLLLNSLTDINEPISLQHVRGVSYRRSLLVAFLKLFNNIQWVLHPQMAATKPIATFSISRGPPQLA